MPCICTVSKTLRERALAKEMDKLKESFLGTLRFDEKVKIVDVLGEMGKDAYDTLNEIRKCARGCWLRYRINEKLHKLL